jgi:hypothetical protein
MKRFVKHWILGFAMVLLIATVSFAGNGRGGGDGTGPIHDILAGVPFEVTGTVVSMYSGQGVEIAVNDGDSVVVYGLGPVWYWGSVGIDRPAIGDVITAIGYIVDYDGFERYITMTMDVGDETVVLRDPDTGQPLWR